ncbi:SRPBCC domain-containing protein [Thalassomonas actiniarum]|uniref:SRPBCC domain-containing protein n=1 Tax=Thalassomonas actiniarum TaxID=485447 RepID=A0AAE9YWE3_9GAMM|nr:SRPBCC domain-containing protein [Thalassomonas actiniarum]WDE02516.1 SRPBCC domain-containing protein [Thalassomonas actiniarum]
MNYILWPENYVPGFADNFCSNEVIVAGLTVKDVWPFLVTPSLWPTYYKNSGNTHVKDDKGPQLADGTAFSFETFGFPVECEVVEYVAPVDGQAARIAWRGWSGEGAGRIDVYHAWLLEELSDNRVRILTQETQNGNPAKELAVTVPNPMINGHQAWLDGLVSAVKQVKPKLSA